MKPPSNGKNFRHVLFTYTLLADHFSDPASIAEMDLLDREIEAAQLSPRLGRSKEPNSEETPAQ